VRFEKQLNCFIYVSATMVVACLPWVSSVHQSDNNAWLDIDMRTNHLVPILIGLCNMVIFDSQNYFENIARILNKLAVVQSYIITLLKCWLWMGTFHIVFNELTRNPPIWVILPLPLHGPWSSSVSLEAVINWSSENSILSRFSNQLQHWSSQ
jgi:hypothetical protein